MIEKLLVLTCLLVFAAVLRGDDGPTADISNGELSVRIHLPDAKTGYYRGTRFDWSGVIYSLQYKGHEYYGPWFDKTRPEIHDFIYEGSDIVAGPCSAVTGPVDEFRPLGWEAAKPGETFLKIGVGALRKPTDLKGDARYDAYRLYEIAGPGKWTVRKGRDFVEFTQQLADPASGYSYVYRKVVRLGKDSPEMLLEHSLRNTGDRPIDTTVYNHNFLIFDKQAPGPGMTMSLPFAIQTPRPPKADLAEIRGKELAYLKTLEGKDVVSCPVQGFSSSSDDHQVKIENSKLGIGMSVTGDRPLHSVNLWSIRSVMAIEPFIAVKAEPGREFKWTSTYRYYTLPKP
jgi:hypothetical protein